MSSLYPPTWSVISLLLLSSLVIHQFTVCLTDLTLQHHASNFPTFPAPPLQHTSNRMPYAYTFPMLSACFHLSCTFFLVFMLVTSSIVLPTYLYAFAYSCSPLFYAYLIIHAGHFLHAFAPFTLYVALPLHIVLVYCLLLHFCLTLISCIWFIPPLLLVFCLSLTHAFP